MKYKVDYDINLDIGIVNIKNNDNEVVAENIEMTLAQHIVKLLNDDENKKRSNS